MGGVQIRLLGSERRFKRCWRFALYGPSLRCAFDRPRKEEGKANLLVSGKLNALLGPHEAVPLDSARFRIQDEVTVVADRRELNFGYLAALRALALHRARQVRHEPWDVRQLNDMATVLLDEVGTIHVGMGEAQYVDGIVPRTTVVNGRVFDSENRVACLALISVEAIRTLHVSVFRHLGQPHRAAKELG